MTCTTKTISWIMIPLIVGFFFGSILTQTHLDVSAPLAKLNATGATGLALVVYDPGFSSFNEEVTRAYVEGLESADWAIHLTTASRQAPSNLADYDLLVLAAPVYAFQPASPALRFFERAGDLQGLPTVFILTAAGTTGGAASEFAERALASNADLVDVLEILQAAPNDELHGTSEAMDIARRAGAALSIP